ncbi:MAG TPA: DNA repair exonuclease [Candidatus Bathyarchaeia archaeon]|nr:DNA repair exonuclease [Candidatus Bathyarchaeia archaeon]
MKISEKNIKEYRFCHTADWHLDYFQYQKSERWYDFIKSANDCANLMIDEKPDFIIHCGDFFHQFKPTPGAIRFAIKILEKFKQENIPFYVIRGNHDASKAQAQRFGGTILKFLEELGYLIYVQDETVNINDNITFTGIGEYGKSTGDVLEDVLRNNPLNQKKFNILALHGYLQGQVSDAIYDISGYQLASMGFNYIALGHYHKQWEEKENKIYCPGSTEQTSLNDWGKPDKDGYFRKSGFYSIKSTLNVDESLWDMDIERKDFDIRPKGRFSFEIKNIDSIESIIERANNFVKKHDLEGAIIRYDFIGDLPIGKQSLINFTNLSAIKESKALHVIVNQQLSNVVLTKARSDLTTNEALLEILEKSYGFKKNFTGKWLDLVNETIKILGHKTINSEEAEEIKLIYDIVTDASLKMSDIELKPTEKKNLEVKKVTPKSSTNLTKTEQEPKNVKQIDLAQFFKEGE